MTKCYMLTGMKWLYIDHKDTFICLNSCHRCFLTSLIVSADSLMKWHRTVLGHSNKIHCFTGNPAWNIGSAFNIFIFWHHMILFEIMCASRVSFFKSWCYKKGGIVDSSLYRTKSSKILVFASYYQACILLVRTYSNVYRAVNSRACLVFCWKSLTMLTSSAYSSICKRILSDCIQLCQGRWYCWIR